jgi:GT2 family glycosyltransferase
MSSVPVIIPFYKDHDKLAPCLQALKAQTHRDLQLFVRDNSDDNIYYTAAINEGLKQFCYDPAIRFVAVLNQDAYLAPDAIASLVDFMERRPEAGMACPLQVDTNGRVQWGGSLQAFPRGFHRRDALESYTAPCETPWANGAALVIRTEVVREIGLFDRNMRFVCSDVDFSFTARARGWKAYVVPQARCEHSLGSSLRSTNFELELIKVQDLLYFAKKWVSGDLYKGLSHEGAGLTRTGIRIEIEKLEKARMDLERIIETRGSIGAGGSRR